MGNLEIGERTSLCRNTTKIKTSLILKTSLWITQYPLLHMSLFYTLSHAFVGVRYCFFIYLISQHNKSVHCNFTASLIINSTWLCKPLNLFTAISYVVVSGIEGMKRRIKINKLIIICLYLVFWSSAHCSFGQSLLMMILNFVVF